MKFKNWLTVLILLPGVLCTTGTSSTLSAGEINYTTLRNRMADEQIMGRGITDKRLLDAFRKVKRHLFVKPELRRHAYNDSPLDIGAGQTISEPYIVAIMTTAVAPGPNKKVLEIGTGSGYHAAILAELAGHVYTIELIEKLGTEARKRLDSLGYKNIKCKIFLLSSATAMKAGKNMRPTTV